MTRAFLTVLLVAAPALAGTDSDSDARFNASLERLERLKRLESGQRQPSPAAVTPAAVRSAGRPDAGAPAEPVELDEAVAKALSSNHLEEALQLAKELRRANPNDARRDRQLKAVATRAGRTLPGLTRQDPAAAERICATLWQTSSADDAGSEACVSLAMRRALEFANQGDAVRARAELGDAASRFDHFEPARKRLGAAYSAVAGSLLAQNLANDAERSAKSAIEFDPDSADPFVVLGQQAFLRSDLEQARSYWERGLRKAPGDRRFQDLLARLAKEEGSLKNFKGRRSEHFVVTFDGAVDEDTAKLALELLDEAWREVGRQFGVLPPEAIGAILYPNQAYDSVKASSWAGGQYDGKIRLPTLGALSHSRQFKAVLFHEYAHALCARAAKGKMVPAWLNEGLAQVSQQLADPQPAVTCGWGHQASLGSLTRGFATIADSRVARGAYTTALHAVQQLMGRTGWDGIRRLLDALAAGQNFDTAFEREVGTSFEAWAKAFDAEATRPP